MVGDGPRFGLTPTGRPAIELIICVQARPGSALFLRLGSDRRRSTDQAHTVDLEFGFVIKKNRFSGSPALPTSSVRVLKLP